jgi:hypothetical protein
MFSVASDNLISNNATWERYSWIVIPTEAERSQAAFLLMRDPFERSYNAALARWVPRQ